MLIIYYRGIKEEFYMKKSRIIAILTAFAMIMSAVPAFAITAEPNSSFIVGDDGTVYQKTGENLISNPSFENGEANGVTKLVGSAYSVSQEKAHEGSFSLKAEESTSGSNAISLTFPVDSASNGYYLSFWYLNNSASERRPRVTFTFVNQSGTVPDIDSDFADDTNSWINAGTASNPSGMEYSVGEWVKYSTVIKGNGNASQCAQAYLNIYGLTKGTSYVDDFEVYQLAPSAAYNTAFRTAIAEWSAKTMPTGPLSGSGTLPITTSLESTNDVLVKWISSDEEKINPETGAYLSGTEDELVVLTARLYIKGHEDIYKDYEYPYIVKSMFTPYIEWINGVFDSFDSSIREDLNFPKTYSIEGYEPITIEWSCSDSEVLDGDGHFTAPETTKYVTLTATLKFGASEYPVTRRLKAMGGVLVSDGLVMYYDFETAPVEGKINNVIESERDYSATLEGVSVTNGYANFSGYSGAIILPSAYATELTGSYTASLWVNMDQSLAQSTGMYRFFDFGGGTQSSQFLRYIPSSGQISFMDRGTSGGASNFALDSKLENITGNWKLLTLVYDFGTAAADATNAATATLYVDGQSFATAGGTYANLLTRSIYGVAGVSSTTGFIGRTQWYGSSEAGNNPDFTGLIDEVRIYNRALSASEIQTLYNETVPTVTAPVTIKYLDTEGNSIAADVTVDVEVDTPYDVPESLKSVPGYEDGDIYYTYRYLASKSLDSITVTSTGDNICTLVFQLVEGTKPATGITNPSFEENVEGWTYNNGGQTGPVTGWIRSKEQAHDGEWSLKRNAQVGSADTKNLGTYIPITPGRIYKFSYWEYSSKTIAAGTNVMIAACVTKDNTSPTDTPSNHLIAECGGISSWYNNGNGISPRDPGLTEGWNQREFTFDTTKVPNANYIFIAYAWGEASDSLYIDDFSLIDITDGEGTDPTPGDDKNTRDAVIQYYDVDGNKLINDVVVKVNKSVKRYEVPVSYRRLASRSDNKHLYTYKFRDDLSNVSVAMSNLRANVCKLVFELEVKDRYANIIENASFEKNIDGWTYNNNGVLGPTQGWVRSDEQAHDGTYSLKRVVSASGASNDNLVTYFPIEPGKIYELSYWEYSSVDIEASGDSMMMAAVVTADNTSPTNTAANHLIEYGGRSSWNVREGDTRDPAYTKGWSKREYTFDTTGAANANYIMIAYAWGKTTEQFYLDDFSLKEKYVFEPAIYYDNGKATVVGPEGETGYFIQALYDDGGTMTALIVSDKLTFNGDEGLEFDVMAGAKLMAITDFVSLTPICASVMAQAGSLEPPTPPSSKYTPVSSLENNHDYAVGIDGTGLYLIPNAAGDGFAVTNDEDEAAGHWSIQVSGNSYILVSKEFTAEGQPKTLDVNGQSMAAGASIGMWASNGGANQRFTIEPVPGTNGFMLKMVQSGLYVTASASGALTQENANSELNQVFTFLVEQ